MMKKIELAKATLPLLLAGVFNFLFPLIPEASEGRDVSVRDVINRTLLAAAKIDTFKADVEIKILRDNAPMILRGKLFFKQPIKSRMEAEFYLSKEWGEGARQDQTTVVDGEVLWQYTPQLKTAIKIYLTPESPPPVGIELVDPFGRVDANSLEVAGEEALDGSRYYVLKGKTKEGENAERDAVTLWIDMDGYFLRRIEVCNAQVDNMTRISFRNVELNVDISDDEFRFSPPEGTKITNLDV